MIIKESRTKSFNKKHTMIATKSSSSSKVFVVLPYSCAFFVGQQLLEKVEQKLCFCVDLVLLN